MRHHRERLLAHVADRVRGARTEVERWTQSHWDRLVSRYGKRKVQQVALVALIVVTMVCGPLSVLATLGIFHSFAQVSPGSPNVIDPSAGTQSTIHLPPRPAVPKFQPLTSRPTMPHSPPPSMQPGSLTLSASADTRFVGSDGRLEVDVPAGAVSAADVAAAAGQQVALRVSEVAPPSGSSAGGSGVVTLGSYLLEVVDGHGNRLAHGLRKGVTLKLHASPQANALDLSHAVVVFNGAHLKSVSGQGPSSTKHASYDLSQHLLTAEWPADPTLTGAGSATPTAIPSATAKPNASPTASATASGTGQVAVGNPLSVRAAAVSAHPASQPTPTLLFTWNTYAPVAKYGAPDPLSVQLNSGSLTEGIALDVPPGPAQAMPNLTLSYNSGSVSEQHSPQGAAGWVGEGWSMGLGQISWAEHNVTVNNVSPGCQAPCASSTWENSWELTDPFGTSTTLIPPTPDAATYADDASTWTYCANGGSGAETCPVQFQTANETYAKVYAYVGPNFPPDNIWNVTPPCWRVYLTNGVMEEFGCTYDSLQWYPVVTSNSVPGGTGNQDWFYPANFLLDLITDPAGDQVHITYQTDTEPIYVANDNNGNPIWYPRDTEPKTVEWDAPDCVNATQACDPNASWHPHYRVKFNAANTVTRLTNSPSGCNLGGTGAGGAVRCDDPLDLSAGGGLGAPLLNGTLVLNDAAVQVNTTGNGGNYNGADGNWNTLRDYQLSYEQSGPSTHADPVTGLSASAAGYLDLKAVKEVGDDGSSAYPATTLSYTSVTEYYEDGNYAPSAAAGCGPSWNTGGSGGVCDLWSQSYDGNSRYISSISNGQGLSQTMTWANARNNTHGVIGDYYPNYPMACDGNEGMGYPCDEADDQAWSRAVVAERDDSVARLTQQGQGGSQTNVTVTEKAVYTYISAYPLLAQECADCVAGFYWGDENDGDYLDYYNGQFMGFAQADISHSDGSSEVHLFDSTMGWGVYDHTKVNCPTKPTTCVDSPWSDVRNAGHGRETAVYFEDMSLSLLKQTTNTYNAVCPPPGAGADWQGQLQSELDQSSNPMTVCDVQLATSVTQTYDTASSSATDTETYSNYDAYGHVTQRTSTTNGGGSSPTTIVHKTQYSPIFTLTVPAPTQPNNPNNNSSQEGGWGNGPYNGLYLADAPTYRDTENSSGVQSACSGSLYNQTTGNTTQTAQYTGCAPTPSGQLLTTTTYDSYGNATGTQDPNQNSSPGCTNATSCTTYDPTTQALTTSTTNALGQTSSVSYSNTPGGGFGLWPTTTTDANSQTTSMTYDPLGRSLTMSLPGETDGWTTSASYANWCSGTGAQTPCVEVDSTQRVDTYTNNDLAVARRFYDGAGRLVETRASAPGGHDVVQYTLYDVMGRAIARSVNYFVTAYTGGPGASAYSIPDTSQAVTSLTYDGLGRTLSVTDPLSFATTTSYAVLCGPPATNGDTGCYERTSTIDANSHLHVTFVDALGRTIYDRTTTGSNGTYSIYATTTSTYDTAGRVVSVLAPDGVSTATATYDTAGRLLATTDPDRGYEYYCYDANGNQTLHADARSSMSGASTCSPPNTVGTTYTGYDALNRPAWRSATNTQGAAYASWSYVRSGNGIGQVASESFNGGTGGSALGHGQYTYSYDVRGEPTGQTITLSGNTYTFASQYNDAGELTRLTYSDGETLGMSYDSSSGAVIGLSDAPTGLGGGDNFVRNLADTILYNANGQVTSAYVGGQEYTYAASYDLDARLSSDSLVNRWTGITDFASSRTYDAVGNVLSASTTLAAGTDHQAFCYDEQNRLVWSSSTSATPPCGGSLTSGTLSAAAYGPVGYAYDPLDRMTSSPSGANVYADTHHVHAITSIGSSYSAAYDAAGNMVCRSPSDSTLCSTTATNGQVFTYDNEGRTTWWQNAPTNPTATEQMAYDGEGRRVALEVNWSSPTYSIGSLEEQTAGTLTKYLPSAPGLPTGVRVGTNVLSYLASDGLGSVDETLDSNGVVTYQQLFTPYGSQRYSSGVPPTSYGFTGQRNDSDNGLDYYNARYYDPVGRQFASADTAGDGLNRFGYVHGNPTTLTDPSGHVTTCTPGSDLCNGRCVVCSGGPTTTPPPPPPPPPPPTGCGACKTSTPLYKCDNVCVAKKIADRAGLVFAAIAGATAVLSGLLGLWITTMTAGFGVFLAGAAIGALLTIGFSAALASAQFYSYDESEGPDPAYFKTYDQGVAGAIGTPADLLAILGTVLSFANLKTLGALERAAWPWVDAVGVDAGTAAFAGASVGVLLGALAALVILPVVAETFFIGPQRDLLFGDEQDCGNNDYGPDIQCPTATASETGAH